MKQTRREISGIVKGNFWRGLYANVTVEAPKKLWHEREISELRLDIEFKKKELALLKESAAETRKQYEEFEEEIKLLKTVIEDSRVKIRELASDTLPLAQARLRLQRLRSHL